MSIKTSLQDSTGIQGEGKPAEYNNQFCDTALMPLKCILLLKLLYNDLLVPILRLAEGLQSPNLHSYLKTPPSSANSSTISNLNTTELFIKKTLIKS